MDFIFGISKEEFQKWIGYFIFGVGLVALIILNWIKVKKIS
jgi:hypothetical protein